MTTITRAEKTYVEQRWRLGKGGRVFTFDVMVEIPDSPKIGGVKSSSKVLFEGQQYVVSHTEIVRTSPKIVRLALNRIDGVAVRPGYEIEKYESAKPFSQRSLKSSFEVGAGPSR